MFYLLLLILSAALPAFAVSPDTALQNRWYRFTHTYNNAYWAQTSQGLFTAESLADSAAAHGYNGVQTPIHAGLLKWNAATINNFKHFVAHCSSRGLEVIPDMFAINSNGVAGDSNFAEADPIDSMRLISRNGALFAAVDSTNKLRNGGLDTFSNNTFTGYTFNDKPGIMTFADTVEKYAGRASARVENFPANSGMARICQTLAVRSHFQYRFRFMLRKEACATAVTVLVIGKTFGNEIQRYQVSASPSTTSWTRYEVEFTTGYVDSLRIYIGVWGAGAISGKFWLDNLELVESPLLCNMVRRAGCPVTIKSLNGAVTYTEGTDFDSIRNKVRLDSIPTSITAGTLVKLDCHRIAFYNGYKTVCMSHEPYYAYADSQARFLYSIFKYKKLFMYIDEIRCAGSCGTCRATGRTTAQILGRCVTRLHGVVRGIDSTVSLYTWADMLDDQWNARPHYYKVMGDLTGSVNDIPGDITIVPWGDCMPAGSSTTPTFLGNSLDFFIIRGFRVMGCGYYDTGNLIGTENWIRLLLGRDSARGLIYSTWGVQDYTQLIGFGDKMTQALTGSAAQQPGDLLKETGCGFSISPNPSFNGVAIRPMGKTPLLEVSIISVNGQIMNRPSLNASGEYRWRAENAPAGVYVVQVRTKKGLFRRLAGIIR